MRKNQNGFGVTGVFLVGLVVAAIGLVGWYVYRHKNTETPSTPVTSQTQGSVVFNAPLGTISHTLKAGESIKLISGPVIQITGRPATEPLALVDSKAATKEASTIPFTSKLSFYHEGYTYDISNQDRAGCKMVMENFGDYTDSVISSCNLQIITRKTTAPVVDTAKLSKQFTVTQTGSPPSQVLSTNPLLIVEPTANARITLPTNGAAPYMESSSFDLTVITNYGLQKISYDAGELYSRQAKATSIGSANVKINVDSITCTSTYMEQNGCGIVFDKFIFTVEYANSQGDKYDSLLLNKD